MRLSSLIEHALEISRFHMVVSLRDVIAARRIGSRREVDPSIGFDDADRREQSRVDVERCTCPLVRCDVTSREIGERTSELECDLRIEFGKLMRFGMHERFEMFVSMYDRRRLRQGRAVRRLGVIPREPG